jgi:hypothetical protein
MNNKKFTNLLLFRNILREAKLLSQIDPLLKDYFIIYFKAEYKYNKRLRQDNEIDASVKKANFYLDSLIKISVFN